MHRTNIYLTNEQDRTLTRLASERGTSKAAVVRQLLDDGLGLSRSREDVLAAVKSAFGAWEERTEAELDELGTLRRAR